MRIFIDARVLNGPIFSGIYEYTRQFIQHLLAVDNFNQYIFFLNSFRRPKGEDFFNDKDKTRNIFVNYHLPNRLLDLSIKFFSFPKIDRFIKADVFYSPNINILALANPTKRILTIHDLSFIHHPEFFGWRQRFWHWRQDLKQQIKNVGLIIAVSDFTKRDIIETLNFPEEKILRIYAGVNPFYQPTKFPPPPRPFIFYLGTIEPRKNISALIKAFNILKQSRQFKDLELILAGEKGWLYDKILKEAQKSPYASNIHFMGRISEEKAQELYNTAAVFVYPSFYEGFGFPPLEAQACGLPVIASDQTSFPEILGSSAILVHPTRIYELASAIEAVLINNTIRNDLKNKGLENVKRFKWQNTVYEFLLCLKSFL